METPEGYKARARVSFTYDPQTGQVDEDPGLEIDQRVNKLLMTSSRKFNYGEAREMVMRDDPELAKRYIDLTFEGGN